MNRRRPRIIEAWVEGFSGRSSSNPSTDGSIGFMLRFGHFTFAWLSDLTAAHGHIKAASEERRPYGDLAAGRPNWGAFRHSPALIGYAWRHLVMSASFSAKT
ncbi:hypothetical protein CEXT_403001 [Caerostris extrusa]|uniref:Uncharacterized protein n=1 Tax=Caerostris extrusa TaxID=172846 RepID=A0AAV4S7M3_CAEEX|nr:hypothetical protein CEXT_403001 [Caerostris extrusa]